MSRHRAFRNRAYSYDEDYNDYDDYEEEEYEDEEAAQYLHPSSRCVICLGYVRVCDWVWVWGRLVDGWG